MDKKLINQIINKIQNTKFDEASMRGAMESLANDKNLAKVLRRLGEANFENITDDEIATLSTLIAYGNYFLLLIHENDQEVIAISNGAFPTLKEKQYLTPLVNTLNWFSDHVLSSIAVSNNLLNFFRACDLSSVFKNMVFPTASNGIDLYQAYVKNDNEYLIKENESFDSRALDKTTAAKYFENFLHNINPKTKNQIYPELSMRREIEEKSVLVPSTFTSNQIAFNLHIIFGADQIKNIINGVYSKDAITKKYENEAAQYTLQVDYVDKSSLQNSLSFISDDSDGSENVADRLRAIFTSLGRIYALYYSLDNEYALKEIATTVDLKIESFKSS